MRSNEALLFKELCPMLAIRKAKGFTLLEVVISAAILSALGFMLLGVFTQSNASMSLGTTKVEIDQTARQAIDRILPLVTTATSFNIGSQRIEFTTTEDFLDSAYDPSTWTFDPINPASFTYEIFFYDPDTGDPNNPGEIRMMRQADWITQGNDATPTADYVVLAGKEVGRVDGRGITNFNVVPLAVGNAVEVQITVSGDIKRPNGNTELVTERRVSIVQMPVTTY